MLAGFGTGFAVDRLVGTHIFAPDTLSTYLVTIGVMVGGTTAIVFAMSVFLLQSTSDLYSSLYLNQYVHGWKEKLVYFLVIVLTIAFFAGALLVGGIRFVPPHAATLVVIGSLTAVGVVFALIDWQYKNVRERISPSSAIAFLEKQGVRFLDQLHKNAKRMAEVLKAGDPSISKDLALAAVYMRVLQPFVATVDTQIENLIEMSVRLSDRHEIATAKRGFAAAGRLVRRFLEARKTSSLLVPSQIVFTALESDSQVFLSHQFERLNRAVEKFLRQGDEETSTTIVDVYRALAVTAGEMRFQGHPGQNPVLDQLEIHVGFLIESAQRANNLEIMFQGARALGDIAVTAVREGLDSTLYGVQQRVLKVATTSPVERHSLVIATCIDTCLRIIKAAFVSKHIARDGAVELALANLAKISNHVFSLIAVGALPNDFSSQGTLARGYNDLIPLLFELLQRRDALTNEDEKRRYQSDLAEFFDHLSSSIRYLAENLRSVDTILVDAIGRLLSEVNTIIVGLVGNTEFHDQHRELVKTLRRNIHLPWWFTQNSTRFNVGSGPLRALIESVATTGLLASEQLQDRNLVRECASSLDGIARQHLEKGAGSYGYAEPRVMKKLCYLGILAQRKGWDDLLTEIGVRIYEFEEKYTAKYGSEYSRQAGLLNELLTWSSEFSRERFAAGRLMPDAETLMYQVVGRADIDRFVFEVWGIFLADSPVADEFKLSINRKGLLRMLTLLRLAKKGR